MKRYAIGVCGLEGAVSVVIVEAQDALSAMCDVVQEKYNWDVREDGQQPFSTVEEAIMCFFDGDVHISEPVEI